MGNKIKGQEVPVAKPVRVPKRRWQHPDGIPVQYSRMHPDGLTYAICPLPPECPIEIRADLVRLKKLLSDQRRSARVTFHQIKVWKRKLSEVPPFVSKSEPAA